MATAAPAAGLAALDSAIGAGDVDVLGRGSAVSVPGCWVAWSSAVRLRHRGLVFRLLDRLARCLADGPDRGPLRRLRCPNLRVVRLLRVISQGAVLTAGRVGLVVAAVLD